MKNLVKKLTCLLLTACLIIASVTYDPATAFAVSFETMMRVPGTFEPDGELYMHPGDLINLRYFIIQNMDRVFVTEDYEWESSDSSVVSLEPFVYGNNFMVKTRAHAVGTADILCKKDGSPTLKMKVIVQDTAPHPTVKARETSVKYPSKWRGIVGIDGTYERVAKEKILKRINEIRYEACENGYPSPDDPDEELTIEDYVPMKWSSDLEWVAQIRAAESTVRQEHDRPNGRPCFTVTHNGVMPMAESLAWNYSGIMEGIEQWYSEKDDWLDQDLSNETGHYTGMITPSIDHVGMSGFVKKSGGYHGIAAEFVSEEYAIQSIYKDISETMYKDNYADRDEKYYDESLYNDGEDSEGVILQLPLLPDNPDGLESLEDLDRLYGIKTLDEYVKLANSGDLRLDLPEEQSDLQGRTIQMVEVVSTKLGEPKIDAPKSIKKGKQKQIFVIRLAFDAPGIVLDTRWQSSNGSVISIKEDGTIKALKPGKSTITAKFGEKTLKKTIKVTK